MMRFMLLTVIIISFFAAQVGAKGIVGENVLQSSLTFADYDGPNATTLLVEGSQNQSQNLDLIYGIGYSWNDLNDSRAFSAYAGPRIYLNNNELINPYAQIQLGFAMLSNQFQYSDAFFDYYGTETYFTYGYEFGAEFNLEQLYLVLCYSFGEIDNNETKGLGFEAGYWLNEQSAIFASIANGDAEGIDFSGFSLGFAVGF